MRLLKRVGEGARTLRGRPRPRLTTGAAGVGGAASSSLSPFGASDRVEVEEWLPSEGAGDDSMRMAVADVLEAGSGGVVDADMLGNARIV
jgi:hypothetical protein